MPEKEPSYCPQCNAPWVSANDFCVQCGEPLMNEGDMHSGPYGYSPNTAYPETQYGSDFDEEAEWNH
jgi:predicted amidophosphoribosyltransferase